MSERILIESVKMDRELRPPEEVDELARAIAAHGQAVSVLLTQDLVLVDGLRRLEALKLLGHQTVEADIATTLEEACANLHEAHGGVPPLHRIWRMWEIKQSLDDLIQERAYHARDRGNKARGSGKPSTAAGPSRRLFVEAFGYKPWDTLITVHRAFDPESPVHVRIMDDLETGHITAHTAWRLMYKAAGFQGHITTGQEQATLLEGVSRQMNTAVQAISRLGPIALPSDQLNEHLTGLKKARAALIRNIHLLEEAGRKP